MTVVQCPACNARIRVPDDRLGTEIDCPRCQAKSIAQAIGPPHTVEQEIALLEARTTAKEVASKYIGKHAIPWIVLLVAIGVIASAYLPEPALPAVVGLVSTAVMALIAMVTGITGLKEREERPEFKVINELITRLDQPKEAMQVSVEGDKVLVSHGGDRITAARVTTDRAGQVKLEAVEPPPPPPSALPPPDEGSASP